MTVKASTKKVRNNVSTKRVNEKSVTVFSQMFKNFLRLFRANKLEECIRILNYGSGHHSLACVIVKTLWGKPVPADFGNAWDSFPNTGYQKSLPELHVLMGFGDEITYIVAACRAMCRAKASGTLKPSRMYSVLRDVEYVMDRLTTFEASMDTRELNKILKRARKTLEAR